MRAEWQGLDDVYRALVATEEHGHRAGAKAVNDVAATVARQQRKLLVLGSHRRGTKTGSPPGSPPWRITGALRDSVKVRRARARGSVIQAQVGATTVYARIQELGGDTGRDHRTHLPPRPSLYPAWKIVRPTVGRTVLVAWEATRR
jgi:hypothetical protein